MPARLDVDVDGIDQIAHAIRRVESELLGIRPLDDPVVGHPRLDAALGRLRSDAQAAGGTAAQDVGELALRTEATARSYRMIDARLAEATGRLR